VAAPKEQDEIWTLTVLVTAANTDAEAASLDLETYVDLIIQVVELNPTLAHGAVAAEAERLAQVGAAQFGPNQATNGLFGAAWCPFTFRSAEEVGAD
jgi:hypothetical protein